MTSPEHFQYCAYCRAELGPYENFQRACTKCDGVFYDNTAGTAGIYLLNDDDQVLLGRRGAEPRKGAWSVPGGFCQPGESALDAARREVQEETGLTDFEILDFIGSFPDRYGDRGWHTLNLLYVARLRSGTPVASDDVSSLEWVDLFSSPDSDYAGSFRNTRESIAALRVWYRQLAPESLR